MSLLNYNGVICTGEELVSNAHNRALRYGEGLIETMLWQKKKIRHAALHYDRLQQSLTLLDFPSIAMKEWMKAIQRTILANQEPEACIIRSQFFSDDQSTALQYMIEALPLPPRHGEWPEQMLRIGISEKVIKSADHISPLKTTSRLLYTVAAAEAAQQQWDDALLLNPEGRVAESTISNVWIIRQDTLLTPPLTEGCISGIFRRYMLDLGELSGMPVREQALSPEALEQADELFLTNAIRGIQPIGHFNGKAYPSERTRQLFDALNQHEA